MSPLQPYQSGKQLKSDFESDEEANKFFSKTGIERNAQKTSTKRNRQTSISEAHNYFTRIENDKLQCMKCVEEGKKNPTTYRPSTSLSVKKTHLRSVHNISFGANDCDEGDCDDSQPKLKVMKLEKKKNCLDSVSKQKFHDAVIDFVVNTSVGIKFMERKATRNFLSIIQNHDIPSGKKNYTTIIFKLLCLYIYPGSTLRRWIKKKCDTFLVGRANYFSQLTCTKMWITFDGWTDKQMRAFDWITIHWIDPLTGELHSCILDVIQVAGGAGLSARLSDAILVSLCENKVAEFVSGSTTDNANEPIATQNLLCDALDHKEFNVANPTKSYHTLRCMNHLLQLGVVEIYNNIKDIIERLRDAVNIIRTSKNKSARFSDVAKNTFKLLSGKPPSLFSHVKWASLHDFLEDSIKKREVLNFICGEFHDLRRSIIMIFFLKIILTSTFF